MLTFTNKNQAEMLEAALPRTFSNHFSADAHALGIMRDGEIVAYAVFQNFGHGQAEFLFGAMDRCWADRRAIRGVSLYGFKKLGLKTVKAHIGTWNIASMVAAMKTGFILRGYLAGDVTAGLGDTAVFVLKQEYLQSVPQRETGEVLN